MPAGVQGHGYAYQDAGSFECQLEELKLGWTRRLEALDAALPLAFPGWNDWDEDGRAKVRRAG